MKKILTILLGVLFVGLSAQTTPPTGASTTENYVYSRTYLEAVTSSSTTAKQVQGIQYFDGLGRPKQSIAIKASPLGKDVVTPVVYDNFGRQTRDYLPIPQSATTNGTIYTQSTGLVSYPVSDPTNIYASEKIYSEKVLESSPLDRVFQQVQPGNDWANKPINFDYLTNIGDAVKKYTITTTWAVANTDVYTTTSSLPVISTYADNTLYKNKVTDEDGNVSYEFKNGQGQTLLVRKVLSATQNADTYYVYNEYNQLALVIPPLAAAKTTLIQSDLDELCYQYRYDNQNRLVEKKLPGKGWEYMVYDQQDRLVLTQDAMLRGTTNNFTKRGWLFTKYDQLGRVVYTGFFANTATRETMQKSLNSMSSNAANNETRDNTTGFAQNGLTVYYTKTAFPTGSMTILSINYYDQYPADLATVPTTIQGETILTATSQTTDKINTRSLPLASFVKNIDSDSWTKNYTFYDLKARAIGTYSYNYLGGYTKTESKLDFAGVPQESYTYHKRLSTDAEITIKERFIYDAQNRLLQHYHKINTNAEELLTNNEYNELGQLKNKKVGGTVTTPLQTVDYRYNIRGWMTKINDLANLGTDLFGYNINYNTLDTNFSGTAKYNGIIAQTTWKTNYSGADTKTRNYSYVYDRMNRLLDAKYTALGTTNDQDYYNENLTYDLNGNITTLKRYSNPASGTTAQKIDDLVYNYENGGYSNKLNKITLPAGEVNNPSGYNALQNAINYDANGNMINQLDKNISAISYNFLNLPNQITQTGGTTNYVYRADGLKVKKTYGTKVTDYLDGFQYETVGTTTTLQFVPTAEGYYDFANSRYTYNYTDHLGNVRVSYYRSSTGSAEVLEENNYYPFGLKHTGYNSLAGNPAYKLGYNGKELQETGQIDYGARFYMPDIGRWGVVDPLAEKMTRHSPYNYAFDNPIIFTDPDGRSPLDWFWNSMTNRLEWYSSRAGILNQGGNLLFNMGKNPTQALTNMGFVTQGTIFSRTRSASFLDGMFNISGDQSKRSDEKRDIFVERPQNKANPVKYKNTYDGVLTVLLPSFSDENASASFNISSIGGIDSKGISYINGINISINGTYYKEGSGDSFFSSLNYSENKLYIDGKLTSQLNTTGLETVPTIGRSFEGRTNNLYKTVNFIVPFNVMKNASSSNLMINVTLGSTNVDNAYRYDFNVNFRGKNGIKP